MPFKTFFIIYALHSLLSFNVVYLAAVALMTYHTQSLANGYITEAVNLLEREILMVDCFFSVKTCSDFRGFFM